MSNMVYRLCNNILYTFSLGAISAVRRGVACPPLWGVAERSESEIHSIAGGNVSSSIGAP